MKVTTNVDGKDITITLTKSQLEEIANQTKVNKTVTERIQGWQDILEELGIEDPAPYKNPSSKFERYLNACARIPKLTEAYNEGKILDWSNGSQYKWMPYKYWSGGGWVLDCDGWDSSLFSSALHFYKEKALAEDSLSKFRDIYEDFWQQ